MTTGVKKKLKVKTGLWSYADEEGNLLKTEVFQNQGKSSYLNGPQTFYDLDGTAVLIRNYKHNKLATEEPLVPCIIILKTETIDIRELGDSIFIFQEKVKDTRWFNYNNIIRINTIEDPDAEYKIAQYKHFEDSIGNRDLLVSSTFSIRHPENVVANPGFEDHPTIERSKTSFNNEIPSWTPASLSPDFFITPTAARGGIAFVGMRVYSTTKDIEYIQNKLNHRLAKGQKYCFSTYVKLGPSCAFATDAFGVHFSANAISFKKLQDTDIKPQLSLDKEFLTYKSEWMLLQCTYTANGSENWMSLGTFKPLDEVNKLPIYGGAGESYYYVDDVSLIPIQNDSECPCNFKGERVLDSAELVRLQSPSFNQDLEEELKMLEVGERLILENVYFDVDKYTLLPKSTETLQKLLAALDKYPKLKIEISGHTSSTGGYQHNITLSKNRANAVLKYLISKGINTNRLTKAGYGPDLPKAPNDSEPNRQMNRRVEVKVTGK
jgi:outer membrane protein OmpA-like peptidoglycan-associated protein